MKLGIFDSGLGGLVIAKAVRQYLPEHDIVYFGDTLHLPYGNRSNDAIYMYTKRAMNYLFEKQDCSLIIIACNTASSAALRRLQQEWLIENWPDRNILGVVVPTLETAIDKSYKRLGLIATHHIISSNIYAEELTKFSPELFIEQIATPLLVPLIENDGEKWMLDVLKSYLAPFLHSQIECLLLGCTHYPYLKPYIKDILGSEVDLLSQDEIIPKKLAEYLQKHPEYDMKISKNKTIKFYVSDLTNNYQKAAYKIYGQIINIIKVEF